MTNLGLIVNAMWFLCAGAPSQPDDLVSQQRMDQLAPVGQSADSVVVLHSADVACQPAITRDLPSDSVDIQQLLAEVISPLCHNIELPSNFHHLAGTLVAEHSAGVFYDSYDKPPADISDLQLVRDNFNPPSVGSAVRYRPSFRILISRQNVPMKVIGLPVT